MKETQNSAPIEHVQLTVKGRSGDKLAFHGEMPDVLSRYRHIVDALAFPKVDHTDSATAEVRPD
jgi:hypothetical protein